MIVDRIEAHFGDGPVRHLRTEFLEEMAKEVWDAAQKQFFSERRSEFRETKNSPLHKIWVSHASHPCARKGSMEVNDAPEKEELPLRAKMRFLLGDLLESQVMFMALEAGCDITDRQRRIEIKPGTGWVISGKIDGILSRGPQRGTLIEVKSMSDRAFKRFEIEGVSDDFGYYSQCQLYANALSAQNVIDDICFVAVNINTGAMAEALLSVDPVANERAIERAREIFSHDRDYISVEPAFSPEAQIKRKKPTGRLVLPLQCSYCPHKEHCWKTQGHELTMFFEGSKPVWQVDEVKC